MTPVVKCTDDLISDCEEVVSMSKEAYSQSTRNNVCGRKGGGQTRYLKVILHQPTRRRLQAENSLQWTVRYIKGLGHHELWVQAVQDKQAPW